MLLTLWQFMGCDSGKGHILMLGKPMACITCDLR